MDCALYMTRLHHSAVGTGNRGAKRLQMIDNRGKERAIVFRICDSVATIADLKFKEGQNQA